MLRLVQFSDIHFKTERDGELILHDDVRDQILDDLRDALLPEVGRVHSVLVAGDIAFSGKREEYLKAAAWLEDVTSVCGCDKTAVLTVPGNHDVNLDRITHATGMLHSRLRSCSLPEAIGELASLVETDDDCLTHKFADYQEFASIYGCLPERASRPIWSRRIRLNKKFAVDLAGLTTIQVSDRQDTRGALLLGRHQYIIKNKPNVEHIVVMHHPLEWFKDRREAEDYLNARARVLIMGHEHLQQITKISDHNGERLVIGSGAVTSQDGADPYTYRYNLIEISLVDRDGLEHLSVRVFPRVWTTGKRFEADTRGAGGKPSQTFVLSCPQFRSYVRTATVEPSVGHSRIEGSNGMAVNDPKPVALLSYYFWRYLGWQDRLKVLVQADVLPTGPEEALPQSVEYLALERARNEGKLPQLWDLVMKHVPEGKRVTNPFPEGDRGGDE